MEEHYRWGRWACPKDEAGAIDHKRAATGEDLIKFVNQELWPYLKGFHDRASGANTIEYKIGEIFSEIPCKFQDGYILPRIFKASDNLAADRGYHMLEYPEKVSQIERIAIPRTGPIRHKDADRKYFRRLQRKRASIEPVISHLKQDHRMDRCRYKGFDGDRINVSLAVTAWNARKWMRQMTKERKEQTEGTRSSNSDTTVQNGEHASKNTSFFSTN